MQNLSMEALMCSFSSDDARWHLVYCPDCHNSMLFDLNGRLTVDCADIICENCYAKIHLYDYSFFTDNDAIEDNALKIQRTLGECGLLAMSYDGYFYHATTRKNWVEGIEKENLTFHAGSLLVATSLMAQRDREDFYIYRLKIQEKSLQKKYVYDDAHNEWPLHIGEYLIEDEPLKGTIVYQNIWEVCGEPSILTSLDSVESVEKMAFVVA